MIAADIAILVPVISILAVIPALCYFDVMARQVNDLFWLVIASVNLPGAVFLYTTGAYPSWVLFGSGLMAGVFIMVHRAGFIEAADTIFLCLISAFFVINPWPLPHGTVQIMFICVLISMMVLTSVIVLVYNALKGNRFGFIGDIRTSQPSEMLEHLVKMMSTYPGGVPFMLPISAAFILTVMIG